MKLTLNQLVPYLPYDLRMVNITAKNGVDYRHEFNLKDIIDDYKEGDFYGFYPVLKVFNIDRILDTLYSTTDPNGNVVLDEWGVEFINHRNVNVFKNNNYDINYLPYGAVQFLIRNHYDVFNLIPKNLAYTNLQVENSTLLFNNFN